MLFPFLIRTKDFGINGFSEVNSKRIQEFKTVVSMRIALANLPRDHSFSTYAKFSRKLTFFTIPHIHVRIRGKKF